MAISEDTIYLAAATITAAILREDAIADPSIRLGLEMVKHAKNVHFLVLTDLMKAAEQEAQLEQELGTKRRFALKPVED